MNLREAFVETTSQLLDENPKLALVLADISVGLFEERGTRARHPERVINVGIREQLLIGVAAGLALEGFRPIAHTYAPFLVERPFEQVKLDLSHQGVGAILVSIGGSFDAAASGRTHQTFGDVALLRTLPDFRIHVPGHAAETASLLRAEADREGSAYLRLTASSNREARSVAPGGLTKVRGGSAGAPTVVAVGPMLDPVLEAGRGLDLTVLYCTTVHPLDRTTLAREVTGERVILVEPYLEGTSLPAITAALPDRPRYLHAIGVPAAEHRHYGSAAEHEAAHGLDAASLRQRLLGWLDSAAA